MEIETVPHAWTSGNVPRSVVIFAPNWLGDAVMALPAIDDVRRALPAAAVAIAARPSIAPLFSLVAGVSDVIVVGAGAAWWRDAIRLRDRLFDAALLLPNSLHTALAAWRAAIPERWGYRRNGRGPLLTRAVAVAHGGHQVEYYQRLTCALGFPAGPAVPHLEVPAGARRTGTELLAAEGWDDRVPLVALAPGAAYGGAKRWPAESFAAVAKALAGTGTAVVMVGGAGDANAAADVEDAAGPAVPLMNLVGRTDLPALAGVLVNCRTLVTNDSGAMHVAAAAGVSVTAMFGPTDERATKPLGPGGHGNPGNPGNHVVLTHHVWCRPCMLRECPIEHRCMHGISVEDVLAAARRTL